MKKLLVSIMLVSTIFMYTGCATSPVGKAVQANSVIIYGVDNSMKAWHDYVVAGNATQQQVDQVKVAYGYYYNAQLLNKAALEKWLISGTPEDTAAVQTANNAVQRAEQALIDLINSFLKK